MTSSACPDPESGRRPGLRPRRWGGEAARVLGLLLASAALLAPRTGQAQGVEDRLRALGVANARLYLQPVVSGLGAGMNSAWFESAATLDPLHVDVSLRAMGSVVPDGSDAFRPVLPATLRIPELRDQEFRDPYGTGQGLTTPTATGQGPGISVEPHGAFRDSLVANGLDPAQFALPFPDGFDIPAVPLAMLQGSVGLPAGTEATVRFLPGVEIDRDIGSLESFGFGVKHRVSRWLPESFPLDLGIAGGIQSFDAGSYLSADSRYVAGIASKELAVLTVFASGALEASDVDVTYTVDNPRLPESGTEISYSDEGANRSRLTTGFGLDLLFLQVGAAYTFSSYDVATAHVGLGF